MASDNSKIDSAEDADEHGFEDESFDSPRGRELIAKVKMKCNAHNIPIIVEKDEFAETLVVSIRSGRNVRDFRYFMLDDVEILANSNFEKYRMVDGLEAIWNEEEHYVEVLLTINLQQGSTFSLFSLFGVENGSEFRDAINSGITLVCEKSTRPRIQISSPSNDFVALFRSRARARNVITAKFLDVTFKSSDEIRDTISSLLNAIFFQIDLLHNITFSIALERHPINLRRANHKKHRTVIKYPEYGYEDAPISLYWYARNARGLPLLQYLAYYQVIEYFFAHYSVEAARKKIRDIIKDPTFRIDRDTDVSKIVTTLINSKSTFGNEADQLKAVIIECVSDLEIRQFIASNNFEEFFLSHDGKKFHPLPLKGSTSDLRVDLSARIYDIRCRIVHTKAEGGRDSRPLLLPRSLEARNLGADIDLIRFVAQKVLINSSSPLSI